MKTIVALFFALILAFTGYSQSAKKWLHKGLEKLDSHNYYGAIFDFTRALENNPRFAEAYYFRGIAKRGMNETMVVSPHVPVKVLQYKAGKTGADTTKKPVTCKLIDYRGTIDSLNEVIRINPKDTMAYFKRGSARMGLKDYQGAVADFSKAIDLDPGHSKAYIQRSFARGALHDSIGSSADLTKAMEIDPRWELVTVYPGGQDNTGQVYFGEIDDYSKAIEIIPGYADAYYQRGLARIKLKQEVNACQDLKKAGELGQKEAEEIYMERCN